MIRRANSRMQIVNHPVYAYVLWAFTLGSLAAAITERNVSYCTLLWFSYLFVVLFSALPDLSSTVFFDQPQFILWQTMDIVIQQIGNMDLWGLQLLYSLYSLIWDFLLSQINIWTTTTWSNLWVVLPKPSSYEFLIGFLIWTPASKYLHLTTFSNLYVILSMFLYL